MDSSTISDFFNGDAVSKDFSNWTSPKLKRLDRSFCEYIERCYQILNYSFWSKGSKQKILFKMLICIKENCLGLSVENFNMVIDLCLTLIDKKIDTDIVYEFLRVLGAFWRNVNLVAMEESEYRNVYPHMCHTLDMINSKMEVDIEDSWAELFLNESYENWEFQGDIELILPGMLWLRILSKNNRMLLVRRDVFAEICSNSIKSLMNCVFKEQSMNLSANSAYKSTFFLETTQGFTDDEVTCFCLCVEKSEASLCNLISVLTKHVELGKYGGYQKKLLLETIFRYASCTPSIYSHDLRTLLESLVTFEFSAESHSDYVKDLSLLFEKQLYHSTSGFKQDKISYKELAAEIDRHIKSLAPILNNECSVGTLKGVVAYLCTQTTFDAPEVDCCSILKIVTSIRRVFTDHLSEEVVRDLMLRLADNTMNCFLKFFNTKTIKKQLMNKIKNSLKIDPQWMQSIVLFILSSSEKASLDLSVLVKYFENFAVLMDDSGLNCDSAIKKTKILELKSKLVLHSFCLAKESVFSMRIASLVSLQYDDDVLAPIFGIVKTILDDNAGRSGSVDKILYLHLMLNEKSLIEQNFVEVVSLFKRMFSEGLDRIVKKDVFHAIALMMSSSITTEASLDFSIKMYRELFPKFFVEKNKASVALNSCIFSLNVVLDSENTNLKKNRFLRNIIRYAQLQLPVKVCEQVQQEIICRFNDVCWSGSLQSPFVYILIKSGMITGRNQVELVSTLIQILKVSSEGSFEDLKNVVELIGTIPDSQNFIITHKSHIISMLNRYFEFNLSIKNVYTMVEELRKGSSMNYIQSIVDKVLALFDVMGVNNVQRKTFYQHLIDAVTDYINILEVSMTSEHGVIKPLFIQSPSIRRKSSGRTKVKISRLKISDSLGAVFQRSNRKIPLERIICELKRELAECSKQVVLLGESEQWFEIEYIV